MDSSQMSKFLSEEYERMYFPDDVGRPIAMFQPRAVTHVFRAIKTWYEHRNSYCHKQGYRNQLNCEKFIRRSEYVYNLVEDLRARRSPCIDYNADILDYWNDL